MKSCRRDPPPRILTDPVKHNGIGGIDPARPDLSIRQLSEDFKFHKNAVAADLFDGALLPSRDGRRIN
jgi:NitT/TauT family transport system substrate-binding protein